MPRIACIIPTYNGERDLSRLLNSLKLQEDSFDIYIVDSSSSDGTQALVKSYDIPILVIPSIQFNHGGTRQLMVNLHPNYDFYIFMTQDAYLTECASVSKIVEPFTNPKVGAVCGRQLPHLDADSFARHARLFNYSEDSCVKSMADIPTLGIKTAFMSNSFSAYRREALISVGGFPDHVIFAEDMFVAARMLMSGWSVAYAGNAHCRHSHNYTFFNDFCRYFDMGVFHSRESWIRQTFGGAGNEGLRFVKSELRSLGIRRWYLWPSSIWRNLIKLIAYKFGQQEAWLPIWICRKMSMYKLYWDGHFSRRSNAGFD